MMVHEVGAEISLSATHQLRFNYPDSMTKRSLHKYTDNLLDNSQDRNSDHINHPFSMLVCYSFIGQF